ncbi:hypothetical protein H2200_006575 [Cladophialophora chaetospira]|uniref:Ketoreductase domain-containing protein n=1 Tax=Cladophialophora chaetospira TaxID=386627 RepID=A0AA39CI03_9EURO|nr:hypothetical protein H2200_006575 [Cladophialophora chaetospira]
MSLRFDGQTILIVGAGNGLGSKYAEYLAKLGANVVVHDTENAVAKAIATSISAAGGHALADSCPFTNGDRVIAAAVARFGRLDAIVLNNTDDVFAQWSATGSNDWDSLLDSTFKSSYKIVQPAWAHFKKQNYGRILCTSSIHPRKEPTSSPLQSVLLHGQLGFVQTLAKEGAKYNILAAVLAPAYSAGLAQPVSESEFGDYLKTVVTLIHPLNTTETGHIYEIGEGRCSKLRWQRSSGAILKPNTTMTPAAIIEKWKDVNEFSKADYPSKTADLVALLDKAKALPPSPLRKQVRLNGRVALVTGAGSGLGRAYARCLARLGAHIVLNDLKEPALVAEEIRRDGGECHMVTCSVEEGEKAVAETMRKYGRIDIVVNNAGFVRDKSIANMTDDLWDSIMAVHLKGTFRVTKAAWSHMVKQRYGRIVNVSSTSGIYGNFGQANYSTAKCAIIGFSEALAREGAKHNILVNAIAPTASTPALAVAVKDASTSFSAEYCAPFVAALCSDSVPYPSTGGLFELAVGWHARTRLQATHGSAIPRSAELTEEAAAQLLRDMADFDSAPPRYPEDAEHGLKEVFRQLPQISVLQRIEAAKKREPRGTIYEYGEREVLLYNLTLGAKRTDLALVYENDKNFQALPTFGAIPYFNSKAPFSYDEILRNWDPTKLLHGEHYLEIRKFPIPTSGKLITYPRLKKVVDKGKAAVVTVGNTTKDAVTGEDIFYNEASAYVRGAGGFTAGSVQPRPSGSTTSTTSTRPPEFSREERTTDEQAALYRLNGDRNAMHIDPVTAMQGGGFSRPILHGLCFFGIAGKHVYQRYGPFKNIRVRFAGTVDPGQTLRTEMWKDRDVVLFQMKVVETGKLCISGGRAELLGQSGKESKL